ncbi:MAG: 4-alpha-glucanotransferase, partial [Treponemataceae bacterium]|nr:4-alpha-glucanotransferase [Treponemataceae bacterium]
MAKSVDKLTLEKLTGTSIPVGSLKTKDSCGIGEFLDLIPFADLCKKCNLELIQILPVNDTGTESSPYSALSAFALNPIYISLKNLPEISENKEILDEIAKLQKNYEKEKRFNYRKIRNEKLAILKKIYNLSSEKIIKDKKLSEWESNNEWVKTYSVFMQKKMKYMEASWKEWPEKGHPTKEQIEEIWGDKKNAKENKFFSWMQMRLDEQVKKAAAYITSLGIKLKGDIPIMMNEDA